MSSRETDSDRECPLTMKDLPDDVSSWHSVFDPPAYPSPTAPPGNSQASTSGKHTPADTIGTEPPMLSRDTAKKIKKNKKKKHKSQKVATKRLKTKKTKKETHKSKKASATDLMSSSSMPNRRLSCVCRQLRLMTHEFSPWGR